MLHFIGAVTSAWVQFCTIDVSIDDETDTQHCEVVKILDISTGNP